MVHSKILLKKCFQSKWVHLWLIMTILLLLTNALKSGHTFIISDIGLRFLQARNLVENHWETFAINYPGQLIDPEMKFVPYYYAWSLLNGQIYLNISPFFPLLLSFLYVLGGPGSVVILPVISGLLTAVAVYNLSLAAELKRPLLAMWAALFASPLLFYSIELWDHILAVACATWAVASIVIGWKQGKKKAVFWGGVIAGIGLGQRPEMYPFALALAVGVLLLHWRFVIILFIGGVVGVLPIWLLQWHWVGHPLGMAMASNLFGYGRLPSYAVQSYTIPSEAYRIGLMLFWLHGYLPVTQIAFLLTILGIGIIVLSIRIPHWQHPRLLWIGTTFITASGILLLWQADRLVLIPGLLSTLPLMALALTFCPGSRIYQFVLTVTLVFTTLMLAVWPTFGGIQWGARYLLPVVPLWVFLAIYNWEWYEDALTGKMQRVWRGAAIWLTIWSVFLQAGGLRIQWLRHQEDLALQQAINDINVQVILTNSPFAPATMSAMPDTIFLYVQDEADVAAVVPQLAANGISKLAVFPLVGAPLSIPVQVDKWELREVEPLVYEIREAS